MPDYRVFKKAHEVSAVNVARQDQQLRHEGNKAAQSFATDSVVSSLLSLISR